MSAQHTPGPWIAEGCEVRQSQSHDPIVDYVYELPDTHLIAAAPDLLKACEAMLAADTPRAIDAAFAAMRYSVRLARGEVKL